MGSTEGNAAVAFEPAPEVVAQVAAPMPPEPQAVDAFVNGAAAALEKAATELPAAKLQALIARGPEGYRELTLYLPEKLAQDLALHCLEHDIDMNRLVAMAVQQHLSGADPKSSVVAPEPQRRAGDAPSEGHLSVMARALLVELAEWLKSAWSSRRRGLGSRSASAL